MNQLSSILLAYLLRCLWRRVDWSSIPAARRRGIAEELAGALVPLSISERSTLGFARALCERFGINPNGSSYVDGSGAERSVGPAYTLVPRGLVPDAIDAIEAKSTPDVVAIRWDMACKHIGFECLRIALHENPSFYTTFATNEPILGEETLFEGIADTSTSSWVPTLPGQLITPRAYRSVWTLTSPLAHGHDTKSGNVVLFRRHRMIDPLTGKQCLVPFISGNAVRGAWRDMIMGRMLEQLGLRTTDLPPQRAHALLAGGTIESGADGGIVDVGARRAAREACPAWDLLAGCIDKQIMRGLLRVDDARLVCRENAWIIWDLLEPRHPNGEMMTREAFAEALPPSDDLTQLRLSTRHAHRDLPGSDGSQMLWNTEVILEGSQFAHTFQLVGVDHVSELSASCMADLLEEFQRTAFIGAGNARGLGRIAFDTYKPGQGMADLPSPDVYRAWLRENADTVRSWLLDDATRVATTKGRGRVKKAPSELAES